MVNRKRDEKEVKYRRRRTKEVWRLSGVGGRRSLNAIEISRSWLSFKDDTRSCKIEPRSKKKIDSTSKFMTNITRRRTLETSGAFICKGSEDEIVSAGLKL